MQGSNQASSSSSSSAPSTARPRAYRHPTPPFSLAPSRTRTRTRTWAPPAPAPGPSHHHHAAAAERDERAPEPGRLTAQDKGKGRAVSVEVDDDEVRAEEEEERRPAKRPRRTQPRRDEQGDTPREAVEDVDERDGTYAQGSASDVDDASSSSQEDDDASSSSSTSRPRSRSRLTRRRPPHLRPDPSAPRTALDRRGIRLVGALHGLPVVPPVVPRVLRSGAAGEGKVDVDALLEEVADVEEGEGIEGLPRGLREALMEGMDPTRAEALLAALSDQIALYDRAHAALYAELAKAQVEESVLSNVKLVASEKRDKIRHEQAGPPLPTPPPPTG
ncbi:hypothetical protein JCM8208_004433 [Rhodotorula glutinis]